MASLISKARKPKFDLHLTIYDLNNVPLVSGVSLIKWHLPHSIHGEHRGRTQKCPIANHRVEYNYSKLVPLRIAIDRNNNLAECWIEFEVLQEFSVGGSTSGPTARDEKITLGTLRINLSEYVEESEALLRDASVNPALHRMSFTPSGGRESVEKSSSHHRRRSSMSGSTSLGGPDASPRSSQRSMATAEEDRSGSDVQEGVIRRYLMEDSKINSTLKIGILMVQVDGERNYIAPPLKTAAVFGGIAGIVAADGFEQTDPNAEAAGQMPLLSHKSRELFELQDAYRRVLTASWTCQPGELPADQCIEDIFAGGDGFRSDHKPRNNNRSPSRPPVDQSSSSTHGSISTGGGGSSNNNMPMRTPSTGSSGAGHPNIPREDSGSTSGGEDLSDMMSTLRPKDRSRLQFHLRNMSTTTVMGGSRDPDRESSRGIGVDRHPHHRELLAPLQMSSSSSNHHHSSPNHHHSHSHSTHYGYHRRDLSKDRFDGGGGGSTKEREGMRSRSESLTSLATTLGSDRGRDGFKRAREVDEFEIREDLVSWAVPGVQTS